MFRKRASFAALISHWSTFVFEDAYDKVITLSFITVRISQVQANITIKHYKFTTINLCSYRIVMRKHSSTIFREIYSSPARYWFNFI